MFPALGRLRQGGGVAIAGVGGIYRSNGARSSKATITTLLTRGPNDQLTTKYAIRIPLANIALVFRRSTYAFVRRTRIVPLFYASKRVVLLKTVTQTSAVTLSKNSKLVQSQAGFYRMTIGDIHVTALSDGTVGLQILDGLLLNASQVKSRGS